MMKKVLRTRLIAFAIILAFVGESFAQKISNEILMLEQKIMKGDLNALSSIIELAKQDPDAAKVLAVIYFKGLGPKKDISKGLESFEQAAMLGDKESMQFLAKFYSVKNSPFKDLEKARYYQLLLQDKGVGNNNNLPSSPETYNKSFSWKPFVEPASQAKAYGSGFAINSTGNFVTNHHVVKGCSKLVVSYDDKKAYGEVLASSKDLDLAVISVSDTTPYYLLIRNKTPAIGDKVKAAGYPKLYFKFSEGIVSAISENSVKFQFSASISSGSSGGPVVDQSAALVGVAQGGYAPGVNESGSVTGADFNFAVDSIHLHKLLTNSGIQFHQATAVKIYSEANIAKILQKTTALITCY